jgi:hypothetical protein
MMLARSKRQNKALHKERRHRTRTSPKTED